MNNNSMNMFMQLMNMGNNPNQIMNMMIQRNQQMNVVLNQMRNSGMTPQQYLNQYAKQNNIDLKPFMNVLNQKGIKF